MKEKEKDPELLEWLESKYTKELKGHLTDVKANVATNLVDPKGGTDVYGLAFLRSANYCADILLMFIERGCS
jgi:hypothetical protein